ncbi:MAG: aldose 1-epimerase [Ruminococcus sp.]|nr:aldose 1-epimerase [Ruminococcus sp.]
MNKASVINWKGMSVIELKAGGYTALIANEIGSNVIRLHDDRNGIEFFRHTADVTPEIIKESPEVWGLPNLYLPNRFADGILKTSDAVYHLPVNEKAPYNNHIHFILQKRSHTVVDFFADDEKSVAKTEYIFDENDEMYQYLPIKFKAEFCFTLSEGGLEHRVKFTNLSNVMMPMSLATHTAINSPFVDGGFEQDIRVRVPISEKWVLNERCLPTGKILPLDDYDNEYKKGTKCPVLVNIDNDMYSADSMDRYGRKFHGIIMIDKSQGKGISYEVSKEYNFWIIWNDKGFNGYFCPEPMTAMIDAPNLDMSREKTGYCEVAPGESYEAWQKFSTLK